MERIEIIPLSQLSTIPLRQIKSIFFESSNTKEFETSEEKEMFFIKWCGNYIEHAPEKFFVALNEKSQVLGYLSGGFTVEKFPIPGPNIFEHFKKDFPAHLHINCSTEFRGLGIGGKLLNSFEELLKKIGVPGMSIVTSPGSKNIEFYKKYGFGFQSSGNLRDVELLFMGKSFNIS